MVQYLADDWKENYFQLIFIKNNRIYQAKEAN
jgi:hypothetical protein